MPEELYILGPIENVRINGRRIEYVATSREEQLNREMKAQQASIDNLNAKLREHLKRTQFGTQERIEELNRIVNARRENPDLDSYVSQVEDRLKKIEQAMNPIPEFVSIPTRYPETKIKPMPPAESRLTFLEDRVTELERAILRLTPPEHKKPGL